MSLWDAIIFSLFVPEIVKLGDYEACTVGKRAVHILLECFLVVLYFTLPIAGSALQFRQAPRGHDEAPPVAHVSDVPPPREADPAAHVQTTNP